VAKRQGHVTKRIILTRRRRIASHCQPKSSAK
jgi:hypothetical protein